MPTAHRAFHALAGLLLVSFITRVLAVPAAPCGDPWCHGNGVYGHWDLDEHGGVVYAYEVDQIHDPVASSPAVDTRYRSATDQNLQLGNDRLVAYASNYGHVLIRQDEGGPKWLHDHDGRYQRGAGYGHLLNASHSLLASVYSNATSGRSAAGASWERRYGLGYLNKTVTSGCFRVSHTVLTPHGDDPVYVSRVRVTNVCTSESGPLWWVEVASGALRLQDHLSSLSEGISNFSDARGFAALHYPSAFTANGSVLTHNRRFVPLSPGERALYDYTQAALYNQSLQSAWVGPVPPLWNGSRASLWDEHPPTVFMADITPPQALVNDAVEWGSDCAAFYGPGGIDAPLGRVQLVKEPTADAACALGKKSVASLPPGGSVTLAFLWMYSTEAMRERFDVHALAAKYRPVVRDDDFVRDTVEHFLRNSVRLRVGAPMQSWLERETVWHSFMTLSSLTFDDYFDEFILDQGTYYRYVSGFQGATRDPLQHVLPLTLLNAYAPKVAGVIRYSLKETHPPAVNELGPPWYSLPYGLMSHGMVSPWALRPSDLELWLLWTMAEYVLSTRDTSLLHESVRFYTQEETGPDHTVAEALSYTLRFSLLNISVGAHGVFRSKTSDWSDTLCLSFVPGCQHTGQLGNAAWQLFANAGESVMNSAIATVVLPRFADALQLANATLYAKDIALARAFAAGQASAMRTSAFNANHTWLRRAFFGDERLGWLGEDEFYMTQHAFALLGGLTFEKDESRAVVDLIERFVIRPSPIGAIALWPESDKPYQGCGQGENGGVWPALNHPLVWALTTVNATLAWEEWMRNALATTATVYPNIWGSIWSSSDAVNAVCAGEGAGQPQWGPTWPVQCTHKHAWPLMSASKLAGVLFDVRGLRLAPAPLPPSVARAAGAASSTSWAFLSPRVSLHYGGDDSAGKDGVVWHGHYRGRLDAQWRLDARLPILSTPLSEACGANGEGCAAQLGLQYAVYDGVGDASCDELEMRQASPSLASHAKVVAGRPTATERERWGVEWQSSHSSSMVLRFRLRPSLLTDAAKAGEEVLLCWQLRHAPPGSQPAQPDA